MLKIIVIVTLILTACIIFICIKTVINAITSQYNKVSKIKESLIFTGFIVFIWFNYIFATIIYLIFFVK